MNVKAGDTIIDGTIGAGGHAERILEKCAPHGRLVGFDKDPRALEEAARVLKRFGGRAMLMHDDFRHIPKKLKESGIEKVEGILLDLGVSSMQLDESSRGFSFRADAPLDMRMNSLSSLTAYDIVNTYSKKELEDLLWELGEERFSRKIAERIAELRKKNPIRTTTELAQIVSDAVPAYYRHGKIHPATRTFQALRLRVNDELGALDSFLSDFLSILGEHGRTVIISFHSLEDRMVKLAFKQFQLMQQGKVLTKKPVVPTDEEIQRNPRSRSAKLRAFEKRMGGESSHV